MIRQQVMQYQCRMSQFRYLCPMDPMPLHTHRALTRMAFEPYLLVVTSGDPFKSTVQLIGVVHGSPANPRVVHEVAAAVQPDAFALEGTEDMQRDMRKAVGSAYLQPLLDKVRLLPLLNGWLASSGWDLSSAWKHARTTPFPYPKG